MTTPIMKLDVPNAKAALELTEQFAGLCHFYKVGLELFTAEGPRIVEVLRSRGHDVFLDLKLHDIPNTVRGAVSSAVSLGVRLLTVHASGGRAMLDAAQEAAGGSGGLNLLAVTVLTSLDRDALAGAWGRDPARLDVEDEVLRLAAMADGAGLHGVVCSGHEAAAIRDRFSGRLAALVPAIRMAGSASDDQARVVTPAGAAAAGAAYVVIGRTVTAAKDPRGAMEQLLAELRGEGERPPS